MSIYIDADLEYLNLNKPAWVNIIYPDKRIQRLQALTDKRVLEILLNVQRSDGRAVISKVSANLNLTIPADIAGKKYVLTRSLNGNEAEHVCSLADKVGHEIAEACRKTYSDMPLSKVTEGLLKAKKNFEENLSVSDEVFQQKRYRNARPVGVDEEKLNAALRSYGITPVPFVRLAPLDLIKRREFFRSQVSILNDRLSQVRRLSSGSRTSDSRDKEVRAIAQKYGLTVR